MEGIFYGVGVGPGDPELLTLKAVRIIQECEVIAVAVSDKSADRPVYDTVRREEHGGYLKRCTAYQTALPSVPGMEEKEMLYLPMPMIKEKEKLKKIHDECADAVGEILAQGKKIAFITLGDPSVYSTCLYVHKRLKRQGYRTCLVPGIPSFCAAAARMDTGLAENREEIHIIPASYGVEESLGLPGTKVLMKAGKKMPAVKQAVKDRGLKARMAENCGMPDERIYEDVEDIPDDAGYYSLMIIKE